MSVSYSDSISETISFERADNKANYERFSGFISALGPPKIGEFQHHVWQGVPGEKVAEFLEDQRVHAGSRKVCGDYLARYIRSQNAGGGLTDWTVALISNLQGDAPVRLGGLEVHPVQRSPKPIRDNGDPVYSIGRLVNPRDEAIDLSSIEWERAHHRTVRQYNENKTRHKSAPSDPSGPSIRSERSHANGLLLIYLLQERGPENLPLVGFATSFPIAANDTPVDYVINTVYWNEEVGY